MIPATKPLNVFLIEDDEIDVENIRRAFRESATPPNLSTAKDGQQAIEMLEAGEVPRDRLVILLDLNMPRMNGIEFLGELRKTERFARSPVVVLTTSDAEQDKLRAYQHNVVGYILKPVTYPSFVSHMKTIEAYWRLQEFP
ncbi:response regulator [Enhygromyxa salina]|uniref:Response regulator rcp1 n=1 Tax=Enhygromyxa salina TaxID=215803 RepID=A0A2S9YJY1_9BACT|nr:response regulator [Enhygromyxa salina]PRQ05408.1 Response regulator rcp1 [Enhygromyxa salina]